jgi:hypothetical protein
LLDKKTLSAFSYQPQPQQDTIKNQQNVFSLVPLADGLQLKK